MPHLPGAAVSRRAISHNAFAALRWPAAGIEEHQLKCLHFLPILAMGSGRTWASAGGSPYNEKHVFRA